jgi:aminoglycoside phosphotransferase (APT) family kinase protein
MNPEQVAEAVPEDALQAWVDANVEGAAGPLVVSHLSGGSSNLTFRVRDDANDWVLRRPPLGRLLATANDMGREYRVQEGLGRSDVPVATTVAMCDDPDVLGVPFYLMTFVPGVVYSDADAVTGLDEAQALAATHELGKPEGFLQRQITRWSGQWEKSKDHEIPAIDELSRRLERSVPAHTDSSVVHGDYSFNNTMWSADDPTRMVAILDWEMSTLGDPLTDLGMVAVYWGEAGELMWRSRAPQPHRVNPGFPGVDHLIARYEAASGRSVRDIDVYRVLAVFKLAIIVEGNLARIRAARPGEDHSASSQLVDSLAALALDIADASSVPTLRGA